MLASQYYATAYNIYNRETSGATYLQHVSPGFVHSFVSYIIRYIIRSAHVSLPGVGQHSQSDPCYILTLYGMRTVLV